MNCTRQAMQFYAVTDRSWTGEQTLYQQVKAALKGGITCLQLREKELDYQSFLDEARQLKSLCQNYKVPFIINDRVQLAIDCGADGVHIGQHDMETAAVRALIGNDTILGVSVQTIEQALTAEKHGADYLGVGAVFPTSTKTDADVVTLETLTAICSAVSIPVVAIGGITKDNISKLVSTQVDGAALVSAIFASQDIEKECCELFKRTQNLVKKMEDYPNEKSTDNRRI